MADHGFWQLSATELIGGYRRRDFSPVEVTQEIVERIVWLDPQLRAYIALNIDDAMEAARAAERAWLSPDEKPPLCGVPVSVKDTIEMRGLPTTYGSLAFRHNFQGDAELVDRLRRAGAVILGKTNTPEFALQSRVVNRLTEPGTNPWNLSRSCGGSSGGAAAAVAAGLGPIAIGTDSGGSIRQPAAFCGIFGLKPTMQRIPAVQTWRASPARSHNGPLTRTVRDSALLMCSSIAGPHSRDPASELIPANYMSFAEGQIAGARIAVSYDFGRQHAPLNSEVRHAVEATASLFSELGCVVTLADPPTMKESDEIAPGVWAYSGDHFAAAEALIPGFWDKHKDDLTDYARPIYDAGRRALAWQYRRILRRDRAFYECMRDWFGSYDFLLCPLTGPATTLDTPDQFARDAETVNFLSSFNHSQNPAAAVPSGFTEGGLPISIQIVGRLGDDVGVLRLSAAVETARPWGAQWPAHTRT